MRKRLLLAGLILLLAIPLMAVIRNFTREVLALMIARILWFGRVVFESTAQEVWWVYFLLAAAYVALRSLIRSKGHLRGRAEAKVEHRGQIEVLTRWIQHAVWGDYFKRRLAQYLGELTLEVLGHEEQVTPGQVERRLKEQSLGVPPEILALLQAELAVDFSEPTGLSSKLGQRLRPSAWTSPPNLDLERVVQFLENRLEV